MNITALAQRSLSSTPKAKDYKELYEETKRNTATFIKLVEEELSKILNQHKKEKAWLQKEIYLLREELKTKNRQSSKCETYRKEEPSRLSLEKYDFNQGTKNIMNCGISQISLDESKSYLTDRKKTTIFNLGLQEKCTNTSRIKEKSFVIEDRSMKGKSSTQDKSTLNITATLKTLTESKENFTSSMLLPDDTSGMSELRERLCKQRVGKKNVCQLKDKDSVSQVLQKIRQKSITSKDSTFNRQEPQYLQTNIISPGMFDRPNKRI